MDASTSVISTSSWNPVLTLTACGRAWELERAADIETLWEGMVNLNEDERLPYWTEVWPSSLVLAEWLGIQRTRIKNRLCLDLGCGIGPTALVGQWLGAKVLAMDYEPEALQFAKKNAVRNNVPQPGWVAMDWRKPAWKPRTFPFIWGGDIMYEVRFAAAILNFLEYTLADDGIFWLAEPRRSVYDTFRSALSGRRWKCRRVHEARIAAIIPQEQPISVNIWEVVR